MDFENIVETEDGRKQQVMAPTEEEKERVEGMFEYKPRDIHTSQDKNRLGDPEDNVMDKSLQSFPRTLTEQKQHPTELDMEMLQQMDKGRYAEYRGDEEDLTCARFPHLHFCCCQMTKDLDKYTPEEIVPGVLMGRFFTSLNVKKLLEIRVTHVLNVSSQEYTKRTDYFIYKNIDVYDNQDEDIKKHFRRTNRFILEALECGGKILIHGWQGLSSAAAFTLAYMISRKQIPLKIGMRMLNRCFPDLHMNEYFKK